MILGLATTQNCDWHCLVPWGTGQLRETDMDFSFSVGMHVHALTCASRLMRHGHGQRLSSVGSEHAKWHRRTVRCWFGIAGRPSWKNRPGGLCEKTSPSTVDETGCQPLVCELWLPRSPCLRLCCIQGVSYPRRYPKLKSPNSNVVENRSSESICPSCGKPGSNVVHFPGCSIQFSPSPFSSPTRETRTASCRSRASCSSLVDCMPSALST
jgi:hypothetical protein